MEGVIIDKRTTANGLVIAKVNKKSLAEEAELQPGDRLVSINHHPLHDIIDYRFLLADEDLRLKIITADGTKKRLTLHKDYSDDLGLEFTDSMAADLRQCHNHCIFCFVDQMRPGMRRQLYVKDDDYRYSFLYGSFITLTNLTDSDLQRIVRQHLSPLYISVHTTNPQLRAQMMRNPEAEKIMSQLQYLTEQGIDFHTQLVLCPGYNDGAELERSIADLEKLWPSNLSIAAVPVGLTRYSPSLADLRPFTAAEAREVVRLISGKQQEFMTKYGEPLVYCSDEFYLLAGWPIPEENAYGGYPQLENGVGISRLFIDQWREVKKKWPAILRQPLTISLPVGKIAAGILRQIVEEMNNTKNLQVNLYPLTNNFFGETVTVTGLLTGSDLAAGLKDKPLGDILLLPQVMLRTEGDLFLDDTTPEELAAQLGVRVIVVRGPQDWLTIVKQYA